MTSTTTLALPLRPKLVDLSKKPTIFNYQLRPTDFEVPEGIRIPQELRDVVFDLEDEAAEVIETMKKLMQRRSDRFFALCPPNVEQFDHHAFSVEHLLEWKEDWNPADPTLATSAKIPTEVLSIFADEAAYRKVTSEYEQSIEAYFKGKVTCWMNNRKAVYHLAHHLMCNPRLLKYNNIPAYKAFCAWYSTTFSRAMREWEAFLNDVGLPTFEETMRDLRGMINDRTENWEGFA